MDFNEIQQKQQKTIKVMKADEKSKHTIKKYNIAFKKFNNFISKHNINRIDNENVNDIMEDYKIYLNGEDDKLKLSQDLSKNTINQYMILINNFLSNRCKLNIEKIDLYKIEKHDPKYINHHQYSEVMNYLETQTHKQQTKHQFNILKTDMIIIMLLFNTGLRIHEALKIKINEITKIKPDHNGNYQLKIIGKGNKKRTIIMTPHIHMKLIQYIQENTTNADTYIFESKRKKGTPITTMTIERHFKKIAKELDAILYNNEDNDNCYQELFKPHNLRHSYAVSNLANGMPINALQKLLGHSNITTTQIYTELNDDSLSDAVARWAPAPIGATTSLLV